MYKRQDLVREHSIAGPSWIDGDTVVSTGTYEVTMRAAGAALVAVDGVCGRGEPGAEDAPASLFALIRPPGHHATADRAMGFCMFNHAAVAARYAQEVLGIERVAILDWDVHHGNGTQDIFEADPSVLFCSLHQWPLYPGSGWLEEVGDGDGQGFTVNLPMPPVRATWNMLRLSTVWCCRSWTSSTPVSSSSPQARTATWPTRCQASL